MRIVENRLLEALDESMKERQQRIKSEERAVQLSKALNRERAQRLHDLHQQSRISSESLAAMQREKAMEGLGIRSEGTGCRAMVKDECLSLPSGPASKKAADPARQASELRLQHAALRRDLGCVAVRRCNDNK